MIANEISLAFKQLFVYLLWRRYKLKQRFEAFLVTPFSSNLMAIDSNVQIFQRKKLGGRVSS